MQVNNSDSLKKLNPAVVDRLQRLMETRFLGGNFAKLEDFARYLVKWLIG
jgi:hypothetical protein